MLLSLALIIVTALLLKELFNKLKLPSLVGMILSGIILGPYALDLLSVELLEISLDLRQIALIIILLRAGLSLDLNDLKEIGRPALLLSFLPATFEVIGVVILGPILLGLTLLESAILGSILAAVSPAVVVPKMLKLNEENIGTNKNIPKLIMAGASVDDVYVIVIFTSLINMAKTGTFSFISILTLPVSIFLGIFIGILFGLLLVKFFKKFHIRDTIKVLVILAFSLFYLVFENKFSSMIPFSGLLATLTMGITILTKYEVLANRLVVKYEKIWVFAEILLFVLVGAAVDITTIKDVGLMAIILIFGSLVFRSIGTYLSIIKNDFNKKEKTFIVGSYLPKATVQASIASIPLSLGISNGSLILTISVLAIVITAPLGALFIDYTSTHLLDLELF